MGGRSTDLGYIQYLIIAIAFCAPLILLSETRTELFSALSTVRTFSVVTTVIVSEGNMGLAIDMTALSNHSFPIEHDASFSRQDAVCISHLS